MGGSTSTSEGSSRRSISSRSGSRIGSSKKIINEEKHVKQVLEALDEQTAVLKLHNNGDSGSIEESHKTNKIYL
jgi:hypothetical protein